MGQLVLSGNPPVTILLRRSQQARRLSLRVSRLDGRVTLTLPKFTPEREAQNFARQKEDWIRDTLIDQPALCRPRFGGHILLAGTEVPIVPIVPNGANGSTPPGRRRAAFFEAGQLWVPGPADRVPVRVAAFLKLTASQQLRAASDHHAARLGVSYARLTLRDTRSRWGSCSSAGNLMYSWRLIMAPPAVLDYVAAHEAAHLREMNHSHRFWSLVQDLCPDYKTHQNWLRDNGSLLHRYCFDPDPQQD